MKLRFFRIVKSATPKILFEQHACKMLRQGNLPTYRFTEDYPSDFLKQGTWNSLRLS
jgi:hypothetical protein